MFDQIRFYSGHSLNDVRANGRRTFFALLCIAAGVAAVVSLQTLIVMTNDALNGNLQAANRGDLQINYDMMMSSSDTTVQDGGVKSGILQRSDQTFFGSSMPSYSITLNGLQQIKAWLNTNYPGQASVTYRIGLADSMSLFGVAGAGTTVTAVTSGSAASQVTPVIVESKVYPYYSTLTATNGQSLAELLQQPTDIVLDTISAGKIGAKVGDTVRPDGANAEFTVRGIVPSRAEVRNFMNDSFAGAFGFYFLDTSAMKHFPNVMPQVSVIYVKLNDPALSDTIFRALAKAFPYLNIGTLDSLRKGIKEVTDQTDQLFSTMGLVSLLLGSIGIANTMQVVVRRRLVEIAVLKTLGLQAEQVTELFLVEALLMGVVGSLFGVLLGWVIAFLIKGVAQTLLAQELVFRPELGPALAGLVIGTLVTTIFGFLPTLNAGQVRPATVLRPTNSLLPRAGLLRTLLALAVIIVALSLVAQTVLGNFGSALIVTVGAFLVAGIVYTLLLLVIWLIGHFLPSFGSVDLKITLKQLLAGRGRNAMTLLALVIGVFSLSLITLFADTTNNALQLAVKQANGGNILVNLMSDQSLNAVEQILKTTDGVRSYGVMRSYQMTLVSLQEPGGTTLNKDQLKARIRTNLNRSQSMSSSEDSGQNESRQANAVNDVVQSLGTLNGLDVGQSLNGAAPQMSAGRAFTTADASKPVMYIVNDNNTQLAGIRLGDKLTYALGKAGDGPAQTFEIIGIEPAALFSTGELFIPYQSVPATFHPTTVLVTVDVDDKQIMALRGQLSAVPGAFVIETAALTQLVSSVVNTFTTFPTLIALLGLIVSGVVIANSVVLTTMERRREIAVMKAIGVQRERVLAMLLLENGLLGFIGGLLGVGIGVVILILILSTSGSNGGLTQVIPYGTAFVLMVLCIAIALVAAATTAWGASGEKPLGVLRFE